MEEESEIKILEESLRAREFPRFVWFMRTESHNFDLLDTWHIIYFIMKQ